MKAITLQQPHASLVVLNAKRIETRSWNTQHRGTILIHAGKAKTKLNRELASSPLFKPYVSEPRVILPFDAFDMMPFGAIIGMVDIIDCVPTQSIRGYHHLNGSHVWHAGGHTWDITANELAFGDYGPGRYAWLMANCVKFDKPIPYKGKLSLWDYEPLRSAAAPIITRKTFSSHTLNLF